MINSCLVCNKCKPRYYKPAAGHLIKSTQPFERLNIDFKGPLPSASQNKYMLVLVDEYSRFPFVYPCKDVSTQSVLKSCSHLFSVFGMPSQVHSDRGTSFRSNEFKNFMHEKGISTSYSSPYHPQGNGQVERFNGTIWRAISLSLEDNGLPVSQWESVLPDVLHSIRSLISTPTNETPHERMFRYQRKSTSGTGVPSWMAEPGPVLMRRHIRSSKYEPLVDEVQLVHANPHYALVRSNEGREMTVSTHDLAPRGKLEIQADSMPSELEDIGKLDDNVSDTGVQPAAAQQNTDTPSATDQHTVLRRSQRARKPAVKFEP